MTVVGRHNPNGNQYHGYGRDDWNCGVWRTFDSDNVVVGMCGTENFESRHVDLARLGIVVDRLCEVRLAGTAHDPRRV